MYQKIKNRELILKAFGLTFQIRYYHNLLEMKAQDKKVDIQSMPYQEKNKLLKSLLLPPKI